jgi:hypothetical protein
VPAVTASGRSHVVSLTVGVKYLTASLIERRIGPRNSVTVDRALNRLWTTELAQRSDWKADPLSWEHAKLS